MEFARSKQIDNQQSLDYQLLPKFCERSEPFGPPRQLNTTQSCYGPHVVWHSSGSLELARSLSPLIQLSTHKFISHSQDIAVDSPSDPSLLQVHLKQSKTDQFRKGIDIFGGRTRNNLCPVVAVLAYIAARGDVSGPLFKFADGRPLTRVRFVAQIRQALESSGLFSQEYAGHSFRIGAATTAAECGVEDSTIKALGRWRSSAFQVYIRLPRQYLASLSSQLSKDHS